MQDQKMDSTCVRKSTLEVLAGDDGDIKSMIFDSFATCSLCSGQIKRSSFPFIYDDFFVCRPCLESNILLISEKNGEA